LGETVKDLPARSPGLGVIAGNRKRLATQVHGGVVLGEYDGAVPAMLVQQRST